ncbi:GNAT family N-acetyltransferase [Flexithrix dorotheae]|uniref:GNAT family N-acetyltransferase n=1 Tax=Flexithrix dorotheae TaxID=70993 RepID=UPI0003663A02|nr:GNAT family N-acetyltransferase [Flexithrix dorotheae]
MKIEIKKGSIRDIVLLSGHIPEFVNPPEEETYKKRLDSSDHLILIAYVDKIPAGFKVGYQKDNDGSFYSWVGAVLPQFRKMGIAQQLMDYQIEWAKGKGYGSIRFKTRNRFKPMFIFGLKNEFQVVGFQEKEDQQESRIILEKII